jgi:CheY-like chemotaxis protein/predicted regulator of Ras-like GTPase activity (Roadblock/LC7/MglB family)
VARVLVVDDSVSVRRAVERMLVPRGLEVASCASGNEALARLPAVAPDLLICDLVLPDLDGYEVCRWLRQVPALAATPVLFISGIVDPDVESRAGALGVEGVLKKPFTGEELIDRVERILADSRVAPPPGSTPSAGAVPPPSTVAAAPPAASAQGAEAPAAAELLASPDGPLAAAVQAAAEAPAAESPAGLGGPPAGAGLRTRELLAELSDLPGFRYAVLLSPEPRVLAVAGELTPAAADPTAGPLGRWLTAAAGLAAQLELGEPGSAVLESGAGTLLARRVDTRSTLVLVLTSSAALGKARFYLARLQRALLEAWEAG